MFNVFKNNSQIQICLVSKSCSEFQKSSNLKKLLCFQKEFKISKKMYALSTNIWTLKYAFVFKKKLFWKLSHKFQKSLRFQNFVCLRQNVLVKISSIFLNFFSVSKNIRKYDKVSCFQKMFMFKKMFKS